LALGLITIGHKSLWSDETYSATVASGTWRSLYQSWREWDANMSLYSVLLHLWREVASSDAFLRSLSALAMAACVPLIVAIGRRLFDSTAGLLAGLIFAVAPYGVQYSQEVRSYALTVLLVSLSTYFFVLGVQSRRPGIWVGYVLCSVLAVYAHFFAVLVPVAHAASLPFLRRELRPIRQLGASAASIVLLLVPGAVLAFTGRPHQLSWMERPGLIAAFREPMYLAGGRVLAVFFLALVVLAATAAWRVVRRIGPSFALWHWSVVFSWLLVPYAISLMYSVTIEPAFLNRYLLVSLPALSLVVALGVRQLTKSWATAATIGIVAISLVYVAHWYGEPAHTDWRGAVAYVLQRSTPADGIVICGHRTGFEYYILAREHANAPTPLSPSGPWQVGFHASGDESPRRYPQRVWLVTEGDDAARRRCARSHDLTDRSRVASTKLAGLRVDAYDA
jgi:mannosyltransferase